MSNNSSIIPEDAWHHLPVYIMYIISGLVISGGNLVIAGAIGRYEALRSNKEYNFMLGLALADCINNGGYLFAGIYRIRLLLAGLHETSENAWTCMTALHNMCFTNGITLCTMMLTVVSSDRLLCVLFPLSYLGWTVTYARSFVGSIYLVNTVGVIYAYASVYGSTVMVSARCVSPTIFKLTTHPLFSFYFSRSPQLYAIASILIYMLVVFFYKRSSSVDVGQHPNQQYELKRQRKVTMTLCLSAVCTLVLYVIPYSIGTYFNEQGDFSTAIVLWSVSNVNALANVVIYPLRHREMRQALKALMACKALPADLKAWNTLVVLPSQQANSVAPPRFKPREARVLTAPPNRLGVAQPGQISEL